MDNMGPTLSARERRIDAESLTQALLRMPSARRTKGVEEQRRAILTDTVERDVIPELLRLYAEKHAPALARLGTQITEAQVAHLVELVLAPGHQDAVAFVSTLHDAGIPTEALFLQLLGPAARLLGEHWVNDTCDFTQVTIGVIHLQHAMRALCRADPALKPPTDQARRALLVPLPGEQHTFGLTMVFEFFQRDGWNAWTGPIASTAELGGMVGSEWVDLVGFSLACDQCFDKARQEIGAVRASSRNRNMVVMVGGPPFSLDPGLAGALGADGTATDGLQAVASAHALVGRVGREPPC